MREIENKDGIIGIQYKNLGNISRREGNEKEAEYYEQQSASYKAKAR